jgi:hypothetical protein
MTGGVMTGSVMTGGVMIGTDPRVDRQRPPDRA